MPRTTTVSLVLTGLMGLGCQTVQAAPAAPAEPAAPAGKRNTGSDHAAPTASAEPASAANGAGEPAPDATEDSSAAATGGSTGSGCPSAARPRRAQRGSATYYHDKFTGRKTANGERYSPHKLTAAHRSLPFGTLVRVTRTDLKGENPVVCVRINDRGPFTRGRIIDVSKRAAQRLKMLRDGVVAVKVEVLADK